MRRDCEAILNRLHLHLNRAEGRYYLRYSYIHVAQIESMFQQQQSRGSNNTPDPQHYEKQLEMIHRASAPPASFDDNQTAMMMSSPTAPPPVSAPPPLPVPSGFNKLCRDQAKLLLVLTTAFLFVNSCGPAIATSGLAIFVLKRGTIWSHKNWKWGLLSCISFLVSTTGYFWVRGSNEINPNRAYGLKMWFWVSASFLTGAWSIILGMFLASSYMSNTAALDPGFYYAAAQQASAAMLQQKNQHNSNCHRKQH